MLQRIKNIFMTTAVASGLLMSLSIASTSALAPLTGLATDSASQQAACQGLSQLDSSSSNCTSSDGATTKVTNTVGTIVKTLSIIVGATAVIFIIIAAFKYITAGGDSTKVGAAKTTLIYALVGLFIAAIAEALVHFVFNAANSV